MTPAEQIVEMMTEDGIAPERAEKLVALFEAWIDAKIAESAPEFLQTGKL